jgi:Ca-activated chloride channel homolog
MTIRQALALAGILVMLGQSAPSALAKVLSRRLQNPVVKHIPLPGKPQSAVVVPHPPVVRVNPEYGKTYPAPVIAPTSMSSTANPAPNNIMIILDGSYSMNEKIDGEGQPQDSKMTVAKRVIAQVIQTLPANTRVGLRVYGQSQVPFLDCQSTVLLSPLGFNNRAEIASQLAKVRPIGQTPISLAIRVSAQQDFAGYTGKKTIVLVSDGQETCDADPCKVGVELVQNGVDVTINTVGLGIATNYDAQRQLKCVALGTNGQFYSADTSASLAKGLQNSVRSSTQVEAKILQNTLP